MRDGKRLTQSSRVPPSFNSTVSLKSAGACRQDLFWSYLPYSHPTFKPIRKFRQWELVKILKIQAYQQKKPLYITMTIRWFKWATRYTGNEIQRSLPDTQNLIPCVFPQTYNENSGIVTFRIYNAVNISRVQSPGICAINSGRNFPPFRNKLLLSSGQSMIPLHGVT
jgi:hypothetical protein